MKIDSVRELKLSLSSLLPDMRDKGRDARPRTAARRLPSPDQSAASMPAPSALALGITPRAQGDYRLAVRVQQRTLQNQASVESIRRKAKGEVEVRYIGAVTKRSALPWYQGRLRPLLPGLSIGHFLVTAGTLGCFTRLRKDQSIHVLSNNHVLANENRAKVGDAVLQPGRYDSGQKAKDQVGSLSSFVRFKKRGINSIDAALAVLAENVNYEPAHLRGLGQLAGLGSDFLDEGFDVSKIGRTTGVTHGRVTAFELDDVRVNFDVGVIRFDGQVEIEGRDVKAFSDSGDSGSLIVDSDCRAVALLFAGSDRGGSNGEGLTFANPLRPVLDALGADLLI